MFDYLWILVLILLLIGAAAYFIYIYKTKGKDAALTKLREAIYQLMLTAERLFNKKKGQDKLEWVVFTIIQSFPDAVEQHIDKNKSVEEVKAFVQKMYNKSKDWADDGKTNNSVE